jgi:flagellar biosynthesis protein FlhF
MTIKTFRAKSIQAALQLVRETLGPDACVHGTREVRGLTGRRLIEVEASGETTEVNRLANAWPAPDSKNVSPRSAQQTATKAEIDQESSIASQLLVTEFRSESPNKSDHFLATPAATSTPLTVSDSATLGIAAKSPGSEPLSAEFPVAEFSIADSQSLAAREIWNELLQLGVEHKLAANLLNQAVQRCDPEYRNDAWLVRGQLNHLVAQQLKVSGPADELSHQQRMIALVGPTGVGKTTLLGKIAAQAYRDSGLQIGIVTLDTWRDAAVQQLLDFAELVEAQLEVVGSLGQLAPALQRLRELDVVLIDTAGRSPNNSEQMLGLKELLQIAQPKETHLVLSCNASPTYAKNAIDQFRGVGATHLCISKLDEGGSIGQWLAPLWNNPLSVMHLTHGQDVEKDLKIANSRHLASILLGQSALAASATESSAASF